MESNKKRKYVRAIDNHEFEKFVRTHLTNDLGDIILLTIGIRSYNGFLQCHDLNAELLDVYDSLNEKDKINLFLHHNSSSPSSTNQVKPAILRELKFFQDESRKQIVTDKNNEINSENSSSTQCENDPKKFKTNSNTYQSIIFQACHHDIEENSTKPINKENEATDWSFDNEEAVDYDIQFKDLTIPQNLIVKENHGCLCEY
ncbi:unnamed protein product [Rotaria sordida]|uniref:Uncharacterized protein n=1 Tax=Rotaria sordida TaxID=392033 RepID=A0A815LXE8_9BILA|nr:unnamed protein product [Rotaria sordida]